MQRKGGLSTCDTKQSRKTTQTMLDLSPKEESFTCWAVLFKGTTCVKTQRWENSLEFLGNYNWKGAVRDMAAGAVRGPTKEEFSTKDLGFHPERSIF